MNDPANPKSTETGSPPSSPLTLAGFQQHIRDRYYAADSARGSAKTFLWLIEEVGELASALNGDDRANLEEEFADVLAWLCTMANINGVDLEAAVRAKYLALSRRRVKSSVGAGDGGYVAQNLPRLKK